MEEKRLLLEGLGVFQCCGERPQQPGELAVASFAVGPAVARLAAVAGLSGRRGELGAGR